MKKLLLIVSHLAFLAFGFVLGIYMLPILTAPTGPSSHVLQQSAEQAVFSGEFRKNLAGSDFLHWGEGKVSVSSDMISLMGELAPGPDYKLYLAPTFVEDEAQFEAVKAQSKQIADIKTFKNFAVNVPIGTNLNNYNTVVVWCESFGEFITAAKYRSN